ncbi:MAG: lipid-A-disaccharide synthase [Fuerstiella sp.]
MRIFFSAGEPSGDQHAAHLIQAMKVRDPDFQAEGFGGPAMKAEGCVLRFELTQLAVMGVLRVLPMLAKFRRLVIQAEQHFDQTPPDAVVLVDFPGFNWWIARAARRRGIPVYYYLPPQLWAWAPWRIRKVRRWVDHVICALPFEYDWYHQRGIKATWVGHPFFDEVASKQLDDALVARLRSDHGRPVIAVLPGSRDHEVHRNFPVMLDVIRTVSEKVPDVRWVVGNYRQDHLNQCRQLQQQQNVSADITYLTDRTSEVIEAADCCLMVSGSISLELLARQTPGVVLYRVSRFARWASRIVMTCRYITLTNLIASEEVMPEFVSAGDPANDVQGISRWLTELCMSPDTLQTCRQKMQDLARRAAVVGATSRTAELLLAELNEETNAANSRQAA